MGFERSSSSCYTHWDKILLPILKTHLKRLPFGSEWKNDLMDYVIKHKIKHPRELDCSLVVEKICPGQTVQSVAYANTTKAAYHKRESYKDLPLYEMKVKLKGKGSNCPFVSGKAMEKDLQH